MALRICILGGCVLCWALADSAVAVRGDEPLSVGDRKQLFIDHKFISSDSNIKLTPNSPEKLPTPVLTSEYPWEAFRLIYFSIIEDQGAYKMWYQAYDGNQWNGGKSRMMFATSTDGFNWVKPQNLGLVSYNGSTNNNIVLDDAKLEYVFLDTNPNAPTSERYKMLGGGGDIGVTRMRTSPDGIHWSDWGQVVWPYTWDTQKQAWWDQDLGKYVIQVRSMNDSTTSNPNALPFPFVSPISSDPPVVNPQLFRAGRALARVETADIMQPWPAADSRTVLCGDELDPPLADIYHPGGVYKYPYADDAYFMFPWVYDHWPDSPVVNDGVLETQFAASRNGSNWMRYDRQVYIPRGAEGEYDYGSTQTLGPFFRQGDNLYQYYMTWPWSHGGFKALTPEEQADPANWGRSEYHLTKHRMDGFVSAEASADGGWFLTPSLMFEGDRLTLNIETLLGGSARVAITDADGNPMPGFGIDNCDPIQADDVDYVVTWNGDGDLSSLANMAVRLRFEMTSAKLYAFQFTTVPEPAPLVALLTLGIAAFLLGSFGRAMKVARRLLLGHSRQSGLVRLPTSLTETKDPF